MTEENTFLFELVSPDAILASETVKMVTVPGEAGDFGVLAKHAPLLSSIRPGVVEITSENGDVKRLFVDGGFADVNETQCTVLAENATDVADLNISDLEKELEGLNKDLNSTEDDAQKSARITQQITIVQEKLKAAA